MKRSITLLLFLLFASQIQSKTKVIVNTNVIRGELFVTPTIDEREINGIIERVLDKKGYKVVKELSDTLDILVIETYLYQRPHGFPILVFIARSKAGVHYIKRKYRKMFMTPKDAFLSILDDFLYEFPKSIDTTVIHEVDLNYIFFTPISNFRTTTTTDYILTRRTYETVISSDNTDFRDFYLKDLDSYVKVVTNINFMKNLLKGKVMIVHISIDQKGKMKVDSIEAPFPLQKYQEKKMNDLVRAIPTWFDKNKSNITIAIFN